MKARRSTIALLGAAMLAGCVWPRSNSRSDRAGTGAFPTGRQIAPKRCLLKVAIVTRPLGDPVINEILWRAVDEQALPAEAGRILEANGLRAGLIPGTLPLEVQEVLDAKPPKRPIEPVTIIVLDGESALVPIGAKVKGSSAVLMNLDGRPIGKEYQNAAGFWRLTATQAGAESVAIRFVPEIQHGEYRRHIGADPTAAALSTQQFVYRDGQDEDTFRELSGTISARPDQVVALGCRAERTRNLGGFLMTEPEPGTDRLLQKVILIWASRSDSGEIPDAKPETVEPERIFGMKPADRPKGSSSPPGGSKFSRKSR